MSAVSMPPPGALEPLGVQLALPPGVAAGTDLALAHLLQEHHGDDLLYCAKLGWLCWDGKRFAPSSEGEAERHVHNIARRLELGALELARAAALADTEEARERLSTQAEARAKWARSAQSANGIRKALEIAATLMSIRVEELDSDSMLLTCDSGTIELANDGRLREHRRADRITKLAPVRYDVSAAAPRWSSFLSEALPDPEICGFVQRYLGYACTASVAEQCFVVALGAGNNGKSVMAETVRRVLGDYTRDTPTDTLMYCKHGRGTENDVARLRSARFVTAKETEQGKKLDEARVKQLTGGDTVTARFLFKEHFEFVPSFKLWLYCNHRPVIVGTDDGIWRRVMLVPFDATVPPEKRDKELPAKLWAEAPGILAWLVRGCVEWQRAGLQPPAAVAAASTQWREESDDVGQFVAECCVIGSFAQVKAGPLHKKYVAWVHEQGGKEPLAPAVLSQRLTALGTARGFVAARTRSKGPLLEGAWVGRVGR